MSEMAICCFAGEAYRPLHRNKHDAVNRFPAMSTVQPAAPAAVIDASIPLPGQPPMAARIYGRRQGTDTPLVLHFHAGSFVGGSLACGERVAQLLADAGAVVVAVDYPLAPAKPFPAALEAGHAALDWVWRRRARLAGSAARLVVAGEEAGGNLAAALALMARDCRQPALAGQILLSPMLDTCVATASLRGAKAGPVGCRWADGWNSYLSRPDDAMHPYAAPAQSTRLAGLPPTLMVTADDDPLRDEAAAYAARLRDIGIPVTSARLPKPTGWPCSLMDESAAEGQAEPAWASAVRQQFTSFLATLPAAAS